MKKLKGFQLVLLLVVPLFWVCDPQTQIDRSIDMASDYNVLVSFKEESFMFLRNVRQEFSTKYSLPYIEDINGFGNGTIVNIEGKSYILTARHCIQSTAGIISKIIYGKDSSDIALIELDSIYVDAPKLKHPQDNSRGQLCYLSFFHSLGDSVWDYRTIFGKLIKPEYDEIASSQAMDKEMSQLELLLRSKSRRDWMDSIMVADKWISLDGVDYDNLDSMLDFGRMYWLEEREIRLSRHIRDSYMMRISSKSAKHARGSSGSSLYNEDGEIIAVTISAYIANYKGESNILVFIPIERILEAVEQKRML